MQYVFSGMSQQGETEWVSEASHPGEWRMGNVSRRNRASKRRHSPNGRMEDRQCQAGRNRASKRRHSHLESEDRQCQQGKQSEQAEVLTNWRVERWAMSAG